MDQGYADLSVYHHLPVLEYSCLEATMMISFLKFHYHCSFGRTSISSEHTSDGCSNDVRYLEHVQARVAFRATKRGAVEIFLTSPSGLESQLLTSRPNDGDSSYIDWTFMTVHHWGENATGDWRLRVQTTEGGILKIFYLRFTPQF